MKFVLLALIASSISFVNSQKIVGCSWTPVNQRFNVLNAAACTHIDVVNFYVDANDASLISKERYLNNPPLTDELFEVKDFRAKNPTANFKLLAVIDSGFATDFRTIVTTPTLAKKLAYSIAAVASNGYDGVTMKINLSGINVRMDIDKLLTPLKDVLQAKGIFLNVRIYSGTSGLDHATICKAADYITVDPYGPAINTDSRPFPLYSQVDADAKKFVTAGCPKNKLILGFTTLGYKHLKNTNSITSISIREFANIRSSLSLSITAEATSIFTATDFQIITDLPYGVKAKTAIAKDLAGAFLVQADQDDNEGIAGFGKWPILTAIIEGLKNPPAPLNSLAAAPLTRLICTSRTPIGDPLDCRNFYNCGEGYSLPISSGLCLGRNFDTKTSSCQPVATAVCAK